MESGKKTQAWYSEKNELEQVARAVAHGYERIHLQHPRLTHADVVRALVAERHGIIARDSPGAAMTLWEQTSSLIRSGQIGLADVAVPLAIAELRQNYADLAQDDLSEIQ